MVMPAPALEKARTRAWLVLQPEMASAQQPAGSFPELRAVGMPVAQQATASSAVQTAGSRALQRTRAWLERQALPLRQAAAF